MATERIGKRIQVFRERQAMSVEELAERAGVTTELIRKMETEDACPSLGPLVKIARALGQRLGTFVDDHIQDDPLIVRREERREEMTMHRATNSRHATCRYHSLGRGKPDRHMEPFHIEVLPGDTATPSSHEGEEFIVVLSGEIELNHGGQTTRLKAGDSAYYNSIVPHHVGAVGAPAEIYAVIYLPT